MFSYATNYFKIAFILCLLICYGETIIKTPTTNATFNLGKCECAAFSMKLEIEKIQLIISHNPINTTCNKYGRDKCLDLCTILAQIGKEHAPKLICPQFAHAVSVKPMMFTRICNEDWIFGNITADSPICCYEGLPILCKA